MKEQISIISYLHLLLTEETAFSGPCQLPRIIHGTYLSGYQAGLTIANGSNVTFQCNGEYYPSPSHEVQCILGQLQPKIPLCKHPSGVDPMIPESDYLGGSDIVKGGEITVFSQHGKGNPCGPPAK